MVSEINNTPPSHIAGIERKASEVNASDKAAAVSSAKASGETVTLTELATRVEELTKSVEKLPISDAEKVARLREEIASGSYQIDADAIAEKFNAIEQILNASAAKGSRS